MKEYKSPVLEEIRERMKHDSWHVKFKRWCLVNWWFISCDIRYWCIKILKIK